MPIMNTKDHFGLMAIFLHWLIALLIIALLAFGLYMVGLPSVFKNSNYTAGIRIWHSVLMLILRIAWRLTNLLPALPAYMPSWQRVATLGMHYAFYVFMLRCH